MRLCFRGNTRPRPRCTTRSWGRGGHGTCGKAAFGLDAVGFRRVWHNRAAAAMTHLRVTLGVESDGLRVVWRLDGVALHAGHPMAQLPLSIAGAPAIVLDGEALAAADDAGPLRLVSAVQNDADGESVRRWRVERASVGPVEVSYLARPILDKPRPATPPLELRREGSGLRRPQVLPGPSAGTGGPHVRVAPGTASRDSQRRELDDRLQSG